MGADLIISAFEVPGEYGTGADLLGWAAKARATADALPDSEVLLRSESDDIPGFWDFEGEAEERVELARRMIADAIAFIERGGDRDCTSLFIRGGWIFVVGLTSWGEGCEALDHVGLLSEFGLI